MPDEFLLYKKTGAGKEMQKDTNEPNSTERQKCKTSLGHQLYALQSARRGSGNFSVLSVPTGERSKKPITDLEEEIHGGFEVRTV